MTLVTCLTFFLAWSAPASAAAICLDVFSRVARAPKVSVDKQADGWKGIRIENSEPSAELLRSLETNELIRELKRHYGTGTHLAIAFDNHNPFGGWVIQGEFATRLLRALFPDALVGSSLEIGSEVRGQKREIVRIHLQDPGMRVVDNSLSMPSLKAVNAGPRLGGRTELRDRLMLPANARLASLYVSRVVSDQEAPVKTLLQSNAADIVLLSLQEPHPDYEAWATRVRSLGAVPVFSSKIGQQKFEAGRKYVVINMSRGLMPLVHAAADYAVVYGPANFFEPIFSGRATYILEDPGLYKKDVWDEMTVQAEQTGLGHSFRDLNELPELIEHTQNDVARKTLFETLDRGGQSAVARLAKEIYEIFKPRL